MTPIRFFVPRALRTACLALGALIAASVMPAAAQSQRPQPYSANELVDSGHKFFGTVSRDLALAIQHAVDRWGEPNGYVLGQEGGGAIVGGLRYGEGSLFTRNVGQHKIFWQGPSIGWDFGGDGARTMMLIYNLPRTDGIFGRFVGVAGSAYLIGGFGATALAWNDIVIVPIRSGVGARLGVNVGYLKFTSHPTWNPF